MLGKNILGLYRRNPKRGSDFDIPDTGVSRSDVLGSLSVALFECVRKLEIYEQPASWIKPLEQAHIL